MAASDDELLDPRASPRRVVPRSGVRRLNARPLILLLIVAAAFLVVMAKTAVDRSEEQKRRARADDAKGGDSTSFAQSITGTAPKGYIPPVPATPPVVPVTKEELEVPPPPPPLPARSSPPPATAQRDTDADKIRNLKLSAMLSAVRAPTAVQTGASGIDAAPTGADPIARLRSSQPERQPAPRPLSGQSTFGTLPGPTAAALDSALPQALQAAAGRRLTGGSANPDPLASAAADPLMPATSSNETDFAARANVEQWDNPTPGRDRWRLRAYQQPPRSAFEIRAGTVLPAILITGINSELAGPILAQVSQNVYDTATGRHLLIPQGTRLFGRYSNEIAYGQSRVLVAWQRLTFPDGRALDIGAMPGADEAGYAGYGDQVNNHYWRLFGNALLLSAITGGVAISQRDSGGGSFYGQQSAGDIMSQQLGVALGQTIVAMIRKNLNISPTIEIRPGYRFNVIATKDITLDRPYQAFDYRPGAAP